MSRSTSIVIRSFNEAEHIGSLLAGIGHQTLQPTQIVLVDSGSTDRTVEIAERFGVDVDDHRSRGVLVRPLAQPWLSPRPPAT